MDIFAEFAARVAARLKALYPEAAPELVARAVVEPPRDAGHGDLSSNAAMVVAKPLGKNPREIATALAASFKDDPERFVFQGVHMILDGDHQRAWGKDEKRVSRIVFIGRHLPEEKIRKGFEACVA